MMSKTVLSKYTKIIHINLFQIDREIKCQGISKNDSNIFFY